MTPEHTAKPTETAATGFELKPSTSLSLSTEIAIILRAQITQYPPGNRNAAVFAEASRIVVREEKMRAALVDLEDVARNKNTTRQMLRDRIEAILKSTGIP